MPLSSDDIRRMDQKPVVIVTASGTAVSIGRIWVLTAPLADVTLRIDVQFRTETMECRMRVPQARMEELAASWDGAMYRYVLPPGDHVWLPKAEIAAKELTPPGAPIIETFPIETRPTNDTKVDPRK